MYLKAIKTLPATPNVQAVAAQKGLDMVDDLANAGNFKLAGEVCDAALSAARTTHSKDLIAQLNDKKKSLSDQQARQRRSVGFGRFCRVHHP